MESALYTALDNSKRQIRLLNILPSESDVRCSLSVVSLDDDLQYDALSYAWGDPNMREPVYVNGFELLVTKNLYDALRTFRDDGSVPGQLWVDAVCINQTDLSERSDQVKLMSQIFRRASIVRIWLGLKTTPLDRVYEVFEMLVKEDLDTPTAQNELDDAFLTSLDDFLSRPWWTRLWVVQESVVAREPLIYVGSDKIPLRFTFSAILVIARSCAFGKPIYLSEEKQTRLRAVSRNFGSIDFHVQDSDLSAKPPSAILDVMGRFKAASDKLTSDPRDRVYALLGILPSSIDITPDYSRSVEEVYQSAIVRLINWSNSLSPLIFAGHHTKTSLPSWVYDFGTILWQSIQHRRFRACPALPLFAEEHSNGRLHVHGKIIDDLRGYSERAGHVGWQTSDEEILHYFRALLRIWRDFALLRADVFGKKEEEGDEDRFWRTVTMDQIYSHELGEAQRYSSTALDKKEINRWLDDDNASLSDDMRRVLIFIGKASMSIQVFFASVQGRFGMIGRDVLEGDIIALLAGASLPFVLRPVFSGSERCYKLVGPCYLDGIMDGEAAPNVKDDELPRSALDVGFEEIVLV